MVAKRSTSVRDALLEAARMEFAEQSYSAATTRGIAQRAGVSEVMLFRHFDSKSNLFREAVFHPLDRNMVDFSARLFPHKEKQPMSSAAWRDYSRSLLKFMVENRPLFIALIVASASEKSTTANVSELTSLDDYFAHAAEVMALSMTDEDLERIGDPAILVRLSFSLVATVAVFGDWLYPDGLMAPDTVVEVMTRFVEHALGMETDAGAGPAVLPPKI